MSKPRDPPRPHLVRGSGLHGADRQGAPARAPDDAIEKERLKDQAGHVLDEARMVLPGIQALFGFQLIAVFNERFARDLSRNEQLLHLAAVALVVVAIALVMTPAAYHRQVNDGTVTRAFIDLSSKLIAGALLPLMVAIALDVYIVARTVSLDTKIALAAAAFALITCGGLWYALPRLHRRRR